MKPGEVIELGPGEKVRCLKSARTDGIFEFEIELDAGVDGPPTHLHHEDETVEVIEGEIVFRVEGRDHHLGPRDTLVIPAGTPHTFFVPKAGTGLRAKGTHGLRFEKVVDQHAGNHGFSRMARYLSTVDPGASYMVSPVIRAVLRLVGSVGRLRGVQLYPSD